jgi:hypothetical protein
VRPGIAVKEKDFFHVSDRTTLQIRRRSLFEVSLHRSGCALKYRQGILQQ